jgi:hypothetical protein
LASSGLALLVEIDSPGADMRQYDGFCPNRIVGFQDGKYLLLMRETASELRAREPAEGTEYDRRLDDGSNAELKAAAT